MKNAGVCILSYRSFLQRLYIGGRQSWKLLFAYRPQAGVLLSLHSFSLKKESRQTQ